VGNASVGHGGPFASVVANCDRLLRMEDIRVDSEGEFRCWNCGNKGLLAKRTFRSKMLVGVGALLTKKKLKCQTCGEYNDTGNAKPYTGPENRKWRKLWEKDEAAKTAVQRDREARDARAQADSIASAVAAKSAVTPSSRVERHDPSPATTPGCDSSANTQTSSH